MARAPAPGPLCVLRGHGGPITALHFAADRSTLLLSGSEEGEIFVWDLQDKRTKCRLRAHDGKAILWLVLHSDGRLLSGGRDGFVNVWSSGSGQWNVSRRIRVQDAAGFCAPSLLPGDHSTLLVAPGRGGLALYDYETGEQSGTTTDCRETPGLCMCLKVTRGGCVVAGFECGDLLLFDATSSTLLSALRAERQPVLCLDCDAEGRGVSGSVDHLLRLWRVDGESRLLLPESGGGPRLTNPGVSFLRIRADGRILLAGGWDGGVRVFAWKSLRPLALLQFHSGGAVQCLDFSPERAFATGGRDKTIALWSLYN